jgi:hypothetical protein
LRVPVAAKVSPVVNDDAGLESKPHRAPGTRNQVLDNLEPWEFDGNWPSGRLKPPQKVIDQGLNESRRLNLLMGVDLIRQLALDINRWLPAAKITQETLGDRCGVSSKVVGHLRNGTGFISLGSYVVLRARVPTAAQMDAGDFRDQVEARKKPQATPRSNAPGSA